MEATIVKPTAESATLSALTTLLFDPAVHTFAVLDGASINGLREKLSAWQPEHCCLFRGELEPGLDEVAPYLVALVADHPFTEWVLKNGWGKHWGIFAQTTADFRTMRRHCRNFFIVSGAGSKPAYFRYYDPRVLRTYLPSCTREELILVFGSLRCYLLENETGDAMLRFQGRTGELHQESVLLARV